jgi:hypothetical protein
VLAACWAHTRRKFYEVHQATASPIAAEVASFTSSRTGYVAGQPSCAAWSAWNAPNRWSRH